MVVGFIIAFLSGRVWCRIRLVASQAFLRCPMMVLWMLQDEYMLVVAGHAVLLEDIAKVREEIC